jgi:hypothetical protein
MAPLTTGAPLVTAHAIHAKAHTHAAKEKKKAHRRAAPAKSRSPKLHPRHSARAAKKAVRSTSAYSVRPGDNLTVIAARHGVSLTALIKANHFCNPNIVLSGSTIRIPHRSATTTRQSTRPRATSRHRDRPPVAKPKHRTTKHSTRTKRHVDRASAEAAATRAALAKRNVPTRTQTKQLIETTARRYGVNPRLALGIGWQESGWNQRAVSPVNAIGAMQVMPQSGEWASMMVGRKLNLLEAHDNVTAGVAILRYLTSNAKNLDQAIGGYYQGLGAMREHGPYPDTRQYIRNVRALMHRL